MDMNQYLSMFIDESREHLQSLNDELLNLEQSPDSLDTIQVIFRSAHTLKGMAATMGFEQMAHLTHEMENALDLMRNEKLNVTTGVMDILFTCVDLLEAQLSSIIERGSDTDIDISQQVELLRALVAGKPMTEAQQLAAAEAAAATATVAPVAGSADAADQTDFLLNQYEQAVIGQAVEKGFTAYIVTVTLSPQCMLRAARAYMVVDAYEQIGELLRAEPSVEDLEQENFEFDFRLLLMTTESSESIQAVGLRISEVASIDVAELTNIGTATSQLTPSKQGEQPGPNPTEYAKSTDANSTFVQSPGANQGNAADDVPETGKSAKPNSGTNVVQHGHKTASKSVRVDTERLDTLLNLFSELVIDRTRLEKISRDMNHPELIETVEHMSRISSDLQNLVMTIRMVPVETVFNRFPRMVRDLAKELGKKVDFNITGAETELDRTVVDEIGDPLVHMLRNALDHGLEAPEKRMQNGKPETGTIHLHAYQSGNHVFIEITDDGNGIDRSKIVKKAVERGLVTQVKADSLSDEEVFLFMFQSGFSTAEKISDVSGRGVGLDVVKNKIESLGGRVIVKSQLGKGTSFIIQLPLTLSIIQAMLVKIYDETYAIPLSSIIETAMIKKSDIKTVHRQAVIDFRGHVVPLISLSRFFQISETEQWSEQERNVVVVRKGERLAALEVHQFIGQQEIVLKSLGKYLSHVFAISGATILGDGQVALIIDCNAIIS
ncbi:chemotaxis protein CheA [Fodinisporobacter ferrooxydans]|uniref:Chemotaxis protein CheA n=1 Tax=Fodinisporobacter ferrooxydans TaxID=2901836 RepID=A0ABY4CJF2_9BACL|nr:chemotaxis protein CheA [Alicyclobacillaceae bacterium MYW30-H2]